MAAPKERIAALGHKKSFSRFLTAIVLVITAGCFMRVPVADGADDGDNTMSLPWWHPKVHQTQEQDVAAPSSHPDVDTDVRRLINSATTAALHDNLDGPNGWLQNPKTEREAWPDTHPGLNHVSTFPRQANLAALPVRMPWVLG